MKEKPNMCTAEKAMNAILDLGFQIKNIYTLWISPSEEAPLEKMGYNPKRMVCVERFDDESVFVEVKISQPICVGLKDGGGKPYKLTHSNIVSADADIKARLTELEKLKQENKELLKMNQELLAKIEARIEVIENKRSKNAQ